MKEMAWFGGGGGKYVEMEGGGYQATEERRRLGGGWPQRERECKEIEGILATAENQQNQMPELLELLRSLTRFTYYYYRGYTTVRIGKLQIWILGLLSCCCLPLHWEWSLGSLSVYRRMYFRCLFCNNAVERILSLILPLCSKSQLVCLLIRAKMAITLSVSRPLESLSQEESYSKSDEPVASNPTPTPTPTPIPTPDPSSSELSLPTTPAASVDGEFPPVKKFPIAMVSFFFWG